MKELINYCPVDGYPSDIPRKQEVIQQFLQKTGIDGLELFLYCNKPLIHSYRETTVGVHLKYWPYWVEFWNGNTENLLHTLGTPEKIQEFYFGARNKDEWIVAIKENIKRALQEEPEYLVWHVSDSDNEEAFTYQFKHSDQEVIQATIEVFNQVSSVIPKTVTVLFENLWWPGMTLLNKELTANFFAELNCDNVGIMLDTGHLMNT
ncbi:MAG TPA: TIM barrel protein, partial [Candidatus Avacidaminococcus intestinavium]|nr:TIM barrel protein [Candidatus Avacidaminococcus intestinavium]